MMFLARVLTVVIVFMVFSQFVQVFFSFFLFFLNQVPKSQRHVFCADVSLSRPTESLETNSSIKMQSHLQTALLCARQREM